MEVIREGGINAGGPGTALALGYFDGVHLGHRKVIDAARALAEQKGLRLAVFTFGAAGGLKGRSILSQRQKEELLAGLGVELCFEPEFEHIRNLTPEAFFNQLLLAEYRAEALACGDDFGFGRARAGNTALLGRLAAAADVALAVEGMAVLDGEPVSSSRIRRALAEGDIGLANLLLGRAWEIDFPVEHGHQLGRTHGFPTINQVFPPERQAPAYGVYITATLVDGVALPSATGYGTRPTVNGQSPTCETFITGYDGDLYGREVRVRFYKKIAETKRFESPEALGRAVQAWAGEAQAYFARHKALLTAQDWV